MLHSRGSRAPGDWWEHESFADNSARLAAELVAFDVLKPALRSRAGEPKAAKEHLNAPGFREAMAKLFNGPPSGRLRLPRLYSIHKRLIALEDAHAETLHRLARMEDELRALRSPDA